MAAYNSSQQHLPGWLAHPEVPRYHPDDKPFLFHDGDEARPTALGGKLDFSVAPQISYGNTALAVVITLGGCPAARKEHKCTGNEPAVHLGTPGLNDASLDWHESKVTHLAKAVSILQGRDISPTFLHVNGLVATAHYAPYKRKNDAVLTSTVRGGLALPSMQPMLQMLAKRYPEGNYRVPLLVMAIGKRQWETQEFYQKALARNAVFHINSAQSSGMVSSGNIEGGRFDELALYIHEEINLRLEAGFPEIAI